MDRQPSCGLPGRQGGLSVTSPCVSVIADTYMSTTLQLPVVRDAEEAHAACVLRRHPEMPAPELRLPHDSTTGPTGPVAAERGAPVRVSHQTRHGASSGAGGANARRARSSGASG